MTAGMPLWRPAHASFGVEGGAFLNADHRENNAVGFSSRSFVLVQFPVVGFFCFLRQLQI